MRNIRHRQANRRRWLLVGWLIVGGGWSWPLLSGCGRQGGVPGRRAAAFSQAVQSVRAAAASAAQVSECGLTAGALLPPNKELRKPTKQRIVYILDAAEGATGASERAASELERLDKQCHDRWDSNCDYLMARIAIMAETAKNRAALGCARVNEPDPPPGDPGAGAAATR